MPRKVERADSSIEESVLILGEMASSKASQNVLPLISLTRTICNDFSKGAAMHYRILLGSAMSKAKTTTPLSLKQLNHHLLPWKMELYNDPSPRMSDADFPFQASSLVDSDGFT